MEKKINEFILVYPPIKQINDLSESKKYLSLFKKAPKRHSSVKSFEINDIIKNNDNNNNVLNIEKEIEKEKTKEEKEKEKENFNCLIEKDIYLRKINLKRTLDIKHALENFLRQSDLIAKITKYFEEYRENVIKSKISKMKLKSNKKGDGTKTEEENEKFMEGYIESLISKLADNVIFENIKKMNLL